MAEKDKILASAQKYQERQQYDKAIREYQRALELDPNDARLLLSLAQCHEGNGAPSEAGKTYVRLAHCYRGQGSYQKALAVFKQAQRLMPEDDEIAVGMAELYNALGLPHEAVGQLEKCLGRAERAQNRKNYIAILQMMVRVDSENVMTRAKYARSLVEAGDTDGARRQFTLALAQLRSKEKYPEYVALALELLRISPKEVEVIKELGQIYIRYEKYQEAIKAMSLLSSEERTPEIRESLISCYIRLHDKDRAVAELKALAHQYTAMGGRPDMVEDAWQRAKRIAPNDAEVNEALGSEPPMLSESSLGLIAVPRADKAINFYGADANDNTYAERMFQTKYNQAFEAYRQGDLEQSRKLALQLIDSNEQYAPALRLLVEICEKQGDNVMLAQVERKYARAVYDHDKHEALRHILKAEKCMPHAWENYNLMLALGFDPEKYDMSASDTKHPEHSNSRIPAKTLNSGASLKPVQAPQRRRLTTGAIVTPGAPPPPPIEQRHRVNTFGQFMQIEVGAQDNPVATKEEEQIGKGLGDLGAVVSNDIDDLFDIVVRPGGAKSEAKPEPLRIADPQESLGHRRTSSAEAPAVEPIVRRRTTSIMETPAVEPVVRRRTTSIMETPAVEPIVRRRTTSIMEMPAVDPALNLSPTLGDGASNRLGNAPRAGSGGTSSVKAILQSVGALSQGSGVHATVSPSLGSGIRPAVSPSIGSGVRNAANPAVGAGIHPGVNPAINTGTHPGVKQPTHATLSQGMPPLRTGPIQARPSARPDISTTAGGTRARAEIADSLSIEDRPATAQTSLYMNAVPGMAMSSPSVTMEPVHPVSPIQPRMAPAAPAPQGIPASERQRVLESIQEIDFYASLSLMDDAKRLLDDLISEFGDTDIIHDAKERLGIA